MGGGEQPVLSGKEGPAADQSGTGGGALSQKLVVPGLPPDVPWVPVLSSLYRLCPACNYELCWMDRNFFDECPMCGTEYEVKDERGV